MNKYRINAVGHLMHDGLKPGDEYYLASDVDARIADLERGNQILRDELNKDESVMASDQARIAELEKALQSSMTALDDWLNTYANVFCDEKRVAEAITRIGEHGGTIAYIANIQALNRQALGL